MFDAEERSLRTRTIVAVFGASAIVCSVFLPWVDAGIGQGSTAYSGLHMLPLAIVELLTAISTIALACTAAAFNRPDIARAAALTALLALAFAAPTILLLETVSSALPTSMLPVTLRRGSLEIGAGIGLWLAAVGAFIAAIAMAGWRPRSVEPRLWAARENRTWALALLSLVVLIGLTGWLRYQTWIGASVASERIFLQGWAAPWLGPLSLFAVWLLVAALVLAMLARTESAGLLAASGGWLLTFIAALAIVTAQSIGGLSDFAVGAVGESSPGFHATGAVWAVFLAGLSAAAVGGWLICLGRGLSASSR